MNSKLKIYNTLTRRIEEFRAINPPNVKMYTCGPTVYKDVHIGNFRTYLMVDFLRRILEYNGYSVDYVKNITDVGHMRYSEEGEQIDPIIKEALKKGKTPQELAEHYTELFLKDEEKLNIKKAWVYPRATQNIKEMIELIQELLKKGLAYETDGTVYFDVKKFKNYGKLSGNTLDKMDNLLKAVRISTEADKKDSVDFALWKKAEPGRVMKWPSPWGEGFPGWHIECSAMSIKYLGEHFDIHTGGEDLIFPHHEDEIAQSEGATGKRFVNYWIHGGYLLVNGEKMARSKGNVYTISELQEKGFDPLAFRYLTMTVHYKAKMNFTFEAMEGAQTALNNLREHISKMGRPGEVIEKYENKFHQAINSDMNMPQALSVVWEVIKSEYYSKEEKSATLLKMDEVFGLNLKEALLKKEEKIPEDVLKLVKEREALRKQKKFHLSDGLRAKIRKMGYDVTDENGKSFIKKI